MRRANRLWWVYVLTAVALATSGSGAAQALFTTLDLGDHSTALTCLTRDGVSLDAVDPRIDAEAYAVCTDGYNGTLGRFTLIGAIALPVAALLLMILGGLWTRWRLRAKRVSGVPAATSRVLRARFKELCADHDLGRRPRLVVAPPGTGVREAFTTGLPGARPWIVVPQSYAHTAPAAFDAVVTHEIGHVRARDVQWASAVWWAGWLVAPVLLLAVLPALNRPSIVVTYYGQGLAIVLLSTVGVLAARAALLRRRELAADAYLVRTMDTPEAMPTLVSGRVQVPRTRFGRVFATHPTVAARLAVGDHEQDGLARWDGGPVFTAAVGVVAMLAFHAVYAVLSKLLGATEPYPLLSVSVALLVAAALWAVVIVPAWTRRAARPDNRWVGPGAGAIAGLVGGFCLEAPGAIATIVATYEGHLWLLIAVLLVAAFAVAVLTAGVASVLSQPADNALTNRLSWAGAILAVVVLLVATWQAAISSTTTYVITGDIGILRGSLHGLGSDEVLRFVPLAILVALGLVVARTRRLGPSRSIFAVVAVTGVVGGVVAVSLWLARPHDDLPVAATYLMVYQRWWTCAFAGLTALVAVTVLGRTGNKLKTVPLAMVSALVSTALAGVIMDAATRLAGYGRDANVFQNSFQLPGWLMLVAVVATSIVVVPAVGLLGHGRPRPVVVIATASTATTLLAVASVGGVLAAVTVSERDHEKSFTVLAAESSTPAAPAPDRDHGRPLDPSEVDIALAALTPVLPAGAQPVADTPVRPVTLTPAACDSISKRNSRDDQSRPRTADRTRVSEFDAEGVLAKATVSAQVVSLTTPQPDLSALDEEIAACAHFRRPDDFFDGGQLDSTAVRAPAPDRPYPSRRTNISLSGRRHNVLVVTIDNQYVALVGHNIVDVDVSWTYARTPPPAATIHLMDQLLVATVDKVIAAL